MNNDSTQSKLEQVIAQYLEAVDSGTPPNRKSLMTAHPDLAPELQSFFINHDMLCAIRLSQSSGPQPDTDQAHATTTGFDNPTRGHIPSFDDYELIDEIARGGMGVVYKARQKSLNRIVALKMIKSGEFANQEQVDRFYKEAEAAANLDHPGIVPVHEVGEVAGQHYFTMGFVDGESLSDRLRNGLLPPKEAARYAKSIAEAVAYAHSKGVIHRDLKPGNVLITQEGVLRITDFGLAKRIEEDSELTSTGQVLGTPSYMPPEQAEGKQIGPAADTYAIGATLYCMLVGKPPFQAANLLETLQQVIERDPVSLASQNPSIPVDLETLCLKCLEKKPMNRYSSASELVHELERFLDGEPIKARPIGKIERAVRWCKRKPLAAGFLLLLVILAIGGPTLWIQLLLSNQREAVSRVETLLNASPATIPLLLSDLDDDANAVRSSLIELKNIELPPDQRLRLSMALLPFDPSQLEYLSQRITDCSYEELAVLLKRMEQTERKELAPMLWVEFHSQQTAHERRFRSGIALATLDPKSPQWQDDDYEFIASSLLGESSFYQGAIRQALAPIANELIEPITFAFRSDPSNDTLLESSAAAIVHFARDDASLLTELSMISAPNQHAILFPVLSAHARDDDRLVDQMAAVVKLQPKPDDNEETRVALGKRRAGASINLLRLDHPDASLEVFRILGDAESLTQFVHGCRVRGVTIIQLLDLLNRATSVAERYGSLVALGEFEVTDIPLDIRSIWVDHVNSLYANDPSSAVHGASGWLLRKWGQGDAVKQVDETPLPYDAGGEREWYIQEIPLPTSNHDGESAEVNNLYITFVVFPPGEYVMGSPAWEQGREPDEQQHRVILTEPLAVSDREITWQQVLPMRGTSEFYKAIKIQMTGWDVKLTHPAVFLSWYDAVVYCRWLTERAGMPDTAQCYADPASLEDVELDQSLGANFFVKEGPPKNWPANLKGSGFRLLTEAEWEFVCRSSTNTAFSFGSDRSLLAKYGWSLENSGGQLHSVAEHRPNLRGMFDLHGNVFEWCHDWLFRTPIEETDPVGPVRGEVRVFRGGSWDYTDKFCRSSYRHGLEPAIRLNNLGFRIATIPNAAKQGHGFSQSSRQSSPSTSIKKWNEGGTLHNKTALEWQNAAGDDKLATCADILTAIWKKGSLNPSIGKSISTAEDLRPFALQLVSVLDGMLKLDAKLERPAFTNTPISRTAAIVMDTMGWTK